MSSTPIDERISAMAPFDLVEPSTGETPVVAEVPHAGVFLDPVSMALCIAPAYAIAQDADLYVDELMVDAPREGATLLRALASRYVLDLNRDERDVDVRAMRGGTARDRPNGLLWHASTRGERALMAPVAAEELERRLAWLYRPYHETLQRVVERKRRRFGVAIVLSVHSMPSPRADTPSGARAWADVVIGTRGGTAASAGLIGLVEDHARSFGWTVSRDDPYPGGATTRRLGMPEQGTQAVQVEMARRLYMREENLTKRTMEFDMTRSFCRGLVAKLGASALG